MRYFFVKILTMERLQIKDGIISIGGEQLQISKRKQSQVTHAYLAYYKEA